MWFTSRQASRLFRIGTTTLLILLDYIVPVFLMLSCSAVILVANFESPRTRICHSQIELIRKGFEKLPTRDKELTKRALAASLLGLFVYAVQSVCYGYEMFSAVYMQVNNYYNFRMIVREGKLEGKQWFSPPIFSFNPLDKNWNLLFPASVCDTRVDVETLRNLPFPRVSLSGTHLLHFLPPRPPSQDPPPGCQKGEFEAITLSLSLSCSRAHSWEEVTRKDFWRTRMRSASPPSISRQTQTWMWRNHSLNKEDNWREGSKKLTCKA